MTGYDGSNGGESHKTSRRPGGVDLPDSDDDRDYDDRPTLAVSRRGLLAASAAGAAVGGFGYTKLDGATDDSALADVVLSEGDLVQADSYVNWRVNTRSAPLPSHLREAVASFTGTGGTARGFVSDGTAGLPRTVESAAFPGVADWEAVAAASIGWFERTHDAIATIEQRETDVVEYRFPTDSGLVDAVRLDRVDDLMTLTIASGDPRDRLGPRTAVRRYAGAVRDRARLR